MLSYLKKLSIALERKQNSLFSYPVMSQKKYLNRLKAPSNDWERSYNQYCCQMRIKNKWITILLNILSLPMIILYYFKDNQKIDSSITYDAVFLSLGISEQVIPDELRREFPLWITETENRSFFNKKDKKYFKKLIKKYPLSWHFLLKCLIKIKIYSYEINSYHPKAIIVCGEYSFTSSLLTDYCRQNNVQHINVMHGEKLFYMRDSFFRYDRCYVWDGWYVDLFISLFADKDQFIVAVPEMMKFENDGNHSKSIDYTYYLGAEKPEILEDISNYLRRIKQRDVIVAVRPHPRYTDIDKARRIFQDIEIENLENISIQSSVLRTRNVISRYSTVLNQAYHSGVNIVIDDLTEPEMYNKLQELQYIVLNQYHYTLLSSIVD